MYAGNMKTPITVHACIEQRVTPRRKHLTLTSSQKQPLSYHWLICPTSMRKAIASSPDSSQEPPGTRSDFCVRRSGLDIRMMSCQQILLYLPGRIVGSIHKSHGHVPRYSIHARYWFGVKSLCFCPNQLAPLPLRLYARKPALTIQRATATHASIYLRLVPDYYG